MIIWYLCSTDNQSVDRAYRIGQTKDVIVYRLMTSATVEEKIYKMQVYKGGLFKTATEHKEQIRYFSQQDLRELLSLPKGGFDVSPTQQQLYEEHYNQIRLDETLESHVKFLETLGIAGVSHHSLLFSKTAPIQPIQQEEVEEIRRGTTSFGGRQSASSSQDNMNDWAKYAIKPKDVLLSDAYEAEGELGIVFFEKFMEHDAYSMFDALMYSGSSFGAVSVHISSCILLQTFLSQDCLL